MQITVDQLDQLEGLITPGIGRVLYDYAVQVEGSQAIVEIGSYKGKSTAFLAAGARSGQGPTVYAVDPWDAQSPPGRDYYRYSQPATRRKFHEQLAAVGLTDQVTTLQGFSTQVAAGYDGAPIGLLYIDGDHTADAVENDFRAWQHHLDVGATVIFDDYGTPKNPGVAEAVGRIAGHFARGVPVEIQADRLAIGVMP